MTATATEPDVGPDQEGSWKWLRPDRTRLLGPPLSRELLIPTARPTIVLRTVTVAALLALALVACGDDKNSVTAKDQPTTTTVNPDVAVSSTPCSTDPDAVEVPLCDGADPGIAYARVEPEPGVGENIRPQAFESAVAEGDDLLVRYVSGVESCYVLDRVDVAETDTEVKVTLQIGTRPGTDVCIELAKYYEVLVPLATPVGDRTVIDGAAA